MEFPSDVNAYIEEEKKYNALLGPFDKHPISSGHCSPFMTRAKPNSDHRHVIINLSWSIGASVNAGIDKTSYLGSTFSLTFPMVDDITRQLKSIGCGALLYKGDVSRAFRHIKIDPGDYDLLGLEWQGVYVDTELMGGLGLTISDKKISSSLDASDMSRNSDRYCQGHTFNTS